MKFSITGIIVAFTIALGTAVSAAPLKLKPSNPQPSQVKSGLNVRYGYSEGKFKSMAIARSVFSVKPKRGKPLRGLDYRNNNFGDIAFTSTAAWYFTAEIKGYYHFAAPGIYDLEFYVNDGIDVKIGGQRVGFIEGINSCEGNVFATVDVPKAGWYDLDMFYYQNAGTACLMMKMGPKGKKRKWVPNSAFGR